IPGPAARGFALRGFALRGVANQHVWDHPVLWREVRRSLMARRWQSWIAGGAMIGLLFLTYAVLAAQDDLSRHFVHQAYACVFNGMFWLLTSVLAATAIAQEKESDTWTVLLTTPLGGH